MSSISNNRSSGHEVFVELKQNSMLATPSKGLKPLDSVSQVARRKIISASSNLAATLSEVENLEDGLRHHAYLRTQLFFISALALWKKAVRTVETPAEVQLTVEMAHLQIGQAHRPGFHAAHSNTVAGFSDDLKDNLTKRLMQEGLTPMKAKILKAKGLSEEQLKELDERHQEADFVSKVIETIWPGKSLFAGTELELQLNATNSLPRDVNLICDKRLEMNIRPVVLQLYAQVMRAELDPKEATQKYVEQIQDHFKKEIERLLADSTMGSRREQQLLYTRQQLLGTQEPDYDLLLGEAKSKSPVVRQLKFDELAYTLISPLNSKD